MASPTVTTRTATITFIAPDIHLMLYNSGITVDTVAIQENSEATATLPPARATIVVVPEGTNFSMDMLENDHSDGMDGASPLRILAMVVEDPVFIQASQLYFAYHPPPYLFRIFSELGPAQAWVGKELSQLRD
jgi:hypothetical protein